MLGVSKSIRAELLALLFTNIDIALEYPLTLEPSTLAYITHLTLSSPTYIVPGTTSRIPDATSSLHLVAAHCPYLQHLTFVTNSVMVHDVPWATFATEEWRTLITEFVEACLDVVARCKKLEGLKVEWHSGDEKKIEYVCKGAWKGGKMFTRIVMNGACMHERMNACRVWWRT